MTAERRRISFHPAVVFFDSEETLRLFFGSSSVVERGSAFFAAHDMIAACGEEWRDVADVVVQGQGKDARVQHGRSHLSEAGLWEGRFDAEDEAVREEVLALCATWTRAQRGREEALLKAIPRAPTLRGSAEEVADRASAIALPMFEYAVHRDGMEVAARNASVALCAIIPLAGGVDASSEAFRRAELELKEGLSVAPLRVLPPNPCDALRRIVLRMLSGYGRVLRRTG